MVNRFTLLGAGLLLGAGAFAFGYMRSIEVARANPEAVLSLEDGVAALKGPELQGRASVPTKGTVAYACPGGRAFAVSYGGQEGRAVLAIDGETFSLDPVFVADGVQFTDRHYTFRAQGGLAVLVLGDAVVAESCRVDTVAAAQAAANGS